jgi:hypothetical protein
VSEPTFGSYLRAARLGFMWAPQIGQYVRIDADGPPRKVECLTVDALMARGGERGRSRYVNARYRCWWEGELGVKALDLIRWPGGRVERNRTYYMNDDGTMVAPVLPAAHVEKGTK